LNRGKDTDNLSENSRISEINAIEERIAEGENRDLKKKLKEMMSREADLKKQIDFYN
jgi:hypothetical protein